ncbi:MAG: glycosyltransferase family 2 protein [Chloroflexaceae bacterium]|nr:glycosyltransferase family 2 protein [Chloroflexaceae bacterium]
MSNDHALLSVVIPAYNEEQRLPPTLARIQAYLALQPYHAEVLVVDDGSTDATASLAEQVDGVRVLRCDHRGKGFAVRTGALNACGDYILLCDADLAVAIDEWEQLHRALVDGHDVAIGSRESLGARRLGEPWYRHLMGRVFNFVVQRLALQGIQDTQCGFKAMHRDVATDLFHHMHIYGAHAPPVSGPAVTAYDVELLFVARRRGYRIIEVPVTWHYGTETKVDPMRDSLRNVRDVLKVRMNDWRGRYPNRTRSPVMGKRS